MAYKFQDDNELTNEYYESFKSKPKENAGEKKTGDYLDNFIVDEGSSASFRVVQLPSQKTLHREFSHYVDKLNLKELSIPSKVKYVTCLENDECVGEQMIAYLRELKRNTEFKSESEQKLFKALNAISPQPRLYMVGIDRRDGKLKIFNAPKTLGEDLLKLFKSKKYGNPANPKTGYDILFEKVDRKTWKVTPSDDESKLTPEEIQLIESCKYSFDLLKKRATPEYQAKLGISFGGSSEPTSETPKEPEKTPEKETPLTVTPEITDDDIPF